MSQSNKRIKNLVIQLSLIQAIFFVILILTSSLYLKENKNKLANAITLIAKEDIINNDIRSAMFNTNKIGQDDFIAIRFLNAKKDPIFTMPSSETNIGFLEKLNSTIKFTTIRKDINFNQKNKIGTFIFIFDQLEYLKHVLLAWLFLILFSIPFVVMAIRKISDDIHMEVDLEKEKFFGESARKWAHDIKQLTEPMKLELEGLNIANAETKQILFQSLNKIDQRILGLLGSKNRFYEKLIDFAKSSDSQDYFSVILETSKTFKEIEKMYRKYPLIKFHLEHKNIERVFIKGSLDEFKRSILNIVSNSVDAIGTKTDGEILIRIKYSNKSLSLEVIDSGPGIPCSIIEKITEKNFSHGKEKGTGEGLYQVKNFTQSLGGNISISSNESEGTKVILEFPATKLSIDKIIHIDDEILLQKVWKRFFGEIGVEIISYTSPDNYLQNKPSTFIDLPIFIDSYMGDQEKGEDFSEKLYEEGFSQIYLSTGDSSQINIKKYPWINKILGKSAKDALNILLTELNH